MSGNGSNRRLDRIERMIEGLTKSPAKPARKIAASDARFERKMAKSAERRNRRMADIRAKTARREAKSARHSAALDRESRRFRAGLRRFAAMAAKDDRGHRKRCRKIEGYLTRLAAAQRRTAESLADLIASMRRDRSGGGRKAV